MYWKIILKWVLVKRVGQHTSHTCGARFSQMACSYGHSKELQLHKNGAFSEEPSNCKLLRRTLVSGGVAICISIRISMGTVD